MSVVVAEVVAARAHLDEESGGFVLEARLANGREIRFASVLDGAQLEEMKETLSYSPDAPKPKRRSRRKPATDTEE